jgi:hypothetical protein
MDPRTIARSGTVKFTSTDLHPGQGRGAGITTRPIPWTPPSSPGDEHFSSALYVGAPGEYAVGGADPTPLLSLVEPAARAMLARRLS